MSFRLVGMVAAGTAACVIGLGQTPEKRSDPNSETLQKETKSRAETAGSTGGVRIFIDPETHQIRQPTPEETRKLSEEVAIRTKAALARSATHQVFRGPGETIGKELDENSMSYLVATKASNGSVSVDCIAGKDSAVAKVQAAKQPISSTAKKGAADDQ